MIFKTLKNEMNNSKKPIIVHFHIFKNAGTTIDTLLERNFSKDAVKMDLGPRERLPWKNVINYLGTKNPGSFQGQPE